MQTDNSDLKRVLDRQNELLEDNNKILHKLHRYELINFWSKMVWFALLIGVPFALYYYVLEPYFEAFGSSYETFNAGIQEIPGIKSFEEFMKAYQESQNK
ncbi:hypothetical protein A2837_00455 [Candidatus Kaiserbacteria bacterium RIFCSPHIGHO2_01_FULL_46_22]|uniref:Uncharacterized protein n=1 Tax=Candidatus Kaiserbacteria bacterium RIFCSPHIGHO2_01_FULL_46_22 TaxID=1798475 RepID=A0A1F6BXH8_9BACT|nr:MAG: hypothetical protein A2837_00455 [Candidatus Kaiserbacteria bacterium RIFCSPHIGHO2_01_FULL_46_22]